MNFKTLDILLSKYNKKEIVFVGLGNTDRGDDASGIIILQKLQNIPDYSKCHFIDAGKNPENHLQKILDYDPKIVVFIDSTDFNRESGTISLIDSGSILRFSIFSRRILPFPPVSNRIFLSSVSMKQDQPQSSIKLGLFVVLS